MSRKESYKASYTQTQAVLSTEAADISLQVNFTSNFATVNQNGYTSTESETPPELPPGKSHVAHCWTVTGQQKELLNIVRSPEKCREKFINRADVDIIIQSIHYNGANLIANRATMKRRAFKFLFYFTKNKAGSLNQADIICLLTELKRVVDDPNYMSFKAKNYLILSLCYVIHNNQILPDIPELDVTAILLHELNTVFYKSDLQYQPTVILLLKALTKRGYSLTIEDVSYLLSWLDVSNPFTQIIENKDDHFESIGSLNTFTWTQERKIRSFKHASDKWQKLSEEAVKYTIEGWEHTKKTSFKAKSAAVVYYQSTFVQDHFPYRERALKCLKSGLEDDEIKIRDRSIFALNNLLHSNPEMPNRKELDHSLARAMSEYRELVLDILTPYVLTNPEIKGKQYWHSILKPLITAIAQADVSKKAKYLNDFLGFNLDSQIEALSNISQSINTTKIFFDIAKGGVNIGKAVTSLIMLIQSEEYPIEARVNAVLALSSYLENFTYQVKNNEFFNQLLNYLIGKNFYSCHTEPNFSNASLKLIAYTVSFYDQINTKQILEKIISLEFNPDCLLNVIFLFSKLLEKIDVADEQNIQIAISSFLSYSKKYFLDEKIKEAIEDLFFLAAKQVNHIQANFIYVISQYLKNYTPQDIYKLLISIGLILGKSNVNLIDEDTCLYLVNSFSQYEFQSQEVVLKILIRQMENNQKAFPADFLTKLTCFLQEPELVDLILTFLSKQVEYQETLSQETLLHVFYLFEQNNPDHEYFAVRLLLNYLEYNHIEFNQSFIDSIHIGLPSMPDAVYSKVLLILMQTSQQLSLDLFDIVDSCIEKFSAYLSVEARTNFTRFLDSIKTNTECYSLKALTKLSENIDLFSQPHVNSVIHFLEFQLKQHEFEGLLEMFPKDYYTIFHSIENFFCHSSSDIHIVSLKKIIFILNLGLNLKYLLAHNSRLLLILSGLLYTIEDKASRDMIVEFINSNHLALTEHEQSILKLDQIHLTHTIHDVFTYIKNHLQNRKQLTKNNYDFLEKLIIKSDPEQVAQVFQIAELAMLNDVLLPDSLLSALLNFYTTHVEMSFISIAIIIDESIKRHIDLPCEQKLFYLVEKEFLGGNLSSHVLRVLYKAVTGNFKLALKTLDTLLNLLLVNNINHVNLAAQILAKAINQYFIDPDRLISRLKSVTAIQSIAPLIEVVLHSFQLSDADKATLYQMQQSIQYQSDPSKIDHTISKKIASPQKKQVKVPSWIEQYFLKKPKPKVPSWIEQYFLKKPKPCEFSEVADKIEQLRWTESQARDIFRKFDLKDFYEIYAVLEYLFVSEPESSFVFLNRPEFMAAEHWSEKITYPRLTQMMLEIHVKLIFSGLKNNELLIQSVIQLHKVRHWPIVKIYEILVKLQEAKLDFEKLQNILDVFLAYKKINFLDVLHVLQNTSKHDLYASLQQLRLKTYMSSVAMNDEPIRKLLEKVNYTWHLFNDNLTVESLIEKVDKEESNYSVYSRIIEENDQIGDWDEDTITRWAKVVKSQPWQTSNIIEILRVINHCIKLTFKYYLRHNQLLALLILYDKPDEIGRIIEVATGEGKSHIIAAFAVIQVLRGQKAHIVTPASTLVERDVKIYANFYKLFGITAASNIDPTYTTGLKACYSPKVDIIYSNADELQFDWLRTHFNNLGTCGDAQQECIIADEVDNPLLDETSSLAMLADDMPGMSSLAPIFLMLWKKVLELKGAKTDLNEADRKQLMSYIDALIDRNSPLCIPNYLCNFVESQKERWVDSACLAVTYRHGCHYEIKIREGGRREITPIDALNTGLLKSGTLWQDGLHQFLQIKHGFRVEPERLTTNFMSTISFFRKYRNHFYGITGTLGSEQSQSLLEDAYHLDCVHVPRYKDRPFMELEGILAPNAEEWNQHIVRSVLRESQLGRPILVLFEFKELAQEFEKLLGTLGMANRVIPYYDNETDQGDKLKVKLKPTDIVVATNLAGRGTDLDLTQAAVDNGGLHVCGTFLPNNKRVEDQAFGRAARKGEPGTAQLILEEQNTRAKLSMLPQDHLGTCDQVKIKRNEQEIEQLSEMRKSTLRRIENKDKLFDRYLELREEFFKHDKADKGWIKNLRSSVRKNFLFYKLRAADERWGIWLKQNDLNSETILQKFDEFKTTLLDDYKKDQVIVNPHYYMNMGAYCLSYVRSRAGKNLPLYYKYYANLALDMYNKALDLCKDEDRKTAFLAYYYRAYIYLKLDGLKNKLQAKQDTLDFMHQTQLQLDVLNQYAEGALPVASSDLHSEDELQAHLLYKIKLYNMMLSSARQNLKEIEQSQKLADITITVGHNDYRESLKLNQDEAKECISKSSAEKVTIGFHHVKNAKDIASNKAADLFKKFKHHSDYGLHYSSNHFGLGDKAKKALLNLLPINGWGKINQLEKEQPNEESSQETAQTSEESSVVSETANEDVIGFSANAKYLGKRFLKGMKTAAAYGKKAVQSSERLNRAARHMVDRVSAAGSAVSKKVGAFGNYLAFLKNNHKEAIKIKTTVEFEFDTIAQYYLWIKNKREQAPLENTKITIEGLTFKQIQLLRETAFSGDINISYYAREKQADQHFLNVQLRPGMQFSKDAQLILTLQNYHDSDIKTLFSILQKNATPTLLETDDLSKIELNDGIALLKKAPSDQDQFKIKITSIGLSQQGAHTLIEQTHLEQCKVTLSFDHLSHDQAVLMSTWNRNHADHAHVVCYDLKNDEAILAIDHVHAAEQAFYIADRDMREDLKDIPKVDAWFPESKLNGFDFLYTLQEKSPMPWRGIAFLLAAGILQIGIGFLIGGLTFGIGFNIATAFVTEGIGEFIKAGIAAYTRSFSMEDYLKNKATAILIATVTMGISAIKAAVTAARAIAAGIAVETSAVSVSNNMANLGIQAGRCVAATSASSTFNFITTSGIEGLQDWLKSRAGATIKIEIDRVLYSSRIIGYLKRVFAYDKWLNTDFYTKQLYQDALDIISQIDKDDFALFEDKFISYLERQFKGAWSLSHVFCEYLNMSGCTLESEQKIALIALLQDQGILHETGISIQVFSDAYNGQGQKKYHATSYDYERLPFKQSRWHHTNCILTACLKYTILNDRSLGYTHQLASLSMPLIDAFWQKSQASLKAVGGALNSLCAVGNSVVAATIASSIKDKVPDANSMGTSSNTTKQSSSAVKDVAESLDDVADDVVGDAASSIKPTASTKPSLDHIIKSVSLGVNMGADMGRRLYIHEKLIVLDKEYKRSLQKINEDYKQLAQAQRDQKSLLTGKYYQIFEVLLTYVFKTKYLLTTQDDAGNDKSKGDEQFELYCRQKLQNDLNAFEFLLDLKATQGEDLLSSAIDFFADYANNLLIIENLIKVFETFYKLKNQKEETTMARDDQNTSSAEPNDSQMQLYQSPPKMSGDNIVALTQTGATFFNDMTKQAMALASDLSKERVRKHDNDTQVRTAIIDLEKIKAEKQAEKQQGERELNRELAKDIVTVFGATDVSEATKVTTIETLGRLGMVLPPQVSAPAATKADEPLTARPAITSGQATSAESTSDDYSPLTKDIVRNISRMLGLKYPTLAPKFSMMRKKSGISEVLTITLETKSLANNEAFKAKALEIVHAIKTALNTQLDTQDNPEYTYDGKQLIITYEPTSVSNFANSFYRVFKHMECVDKPKEEFGYNHKVTCAIQ